VRTEEHSEAERVFVVHGRNAVARRSVAEFLRAIGLEPIEWEQAVQATDKPNPFIGEILDSGLAHARAVLVLLTGDDEARLRAELRSKHDPHYESTYTPQPRQNVLFEAGIAFGTHPTRTVICQIGEVRPFSDIFGRHFVRLDNSVARRQHLAQLLEAAGCAVNLSGTDWHSAGNFELPDSNRRVRMRRWLFALLSALLFIGLLVSSVYALYSFRILDGSGRVWVNLSQYQRHFDHHTSLGFYPLRVDGRVRDGVNEVSAVWKFNDKSVAWASYHWMTKQEFDQREQELTSQGYRRESLTTFTDTTGTERFLATWSK
jgi:predicted nucleotide-binding protein